jgi:hypothetical protein
MNSLAVLKMKDITIIIGVRGWSAMVVGNLFIDFTSNTQLIGTRTSFILYFLRFGLDQTIV